MYSGWIKAFKVDRMIRSDERISELRRQRHPRVEPSDWGALVHFNSTSADFIDRRYRLRGMVSTAAGILGSLVMFGLGSWLISFFLVTGYKMSADHELPSMLGSFMVFSIVAAAILSFWWLYLRHDMFVYTHYPVRFNRKARKVHVFRSNAPGGVLAVPFDDVFWHVGRGLQQSYQPSGPVNRSACPGVRDGGFRGLKDGRITSLLCKTGPQKNRLGTRRKQRHGPQQARQHVAQAEPAVEPVGGFGQVTPRVRGLLDGGPPSEGMNKEMTMRRLVLFVVVVLTVGGCVSTPAGQVRTDGCTLLETPLFDARLHESRVSQDKSACYLEGFASNRRVAEQQVKFFEAEIGGRCGLMTRSSELSSATLGESAGYEFAVAVSRRPDADACRDEVEASVELEGASVDVASRNRNPPSYPQDAVMSGVEGRVTLVVQVEANGDLGAVIVETSSGSAKLDAAAVEGAARWRFYPGGSANEPVQSLVRVPVIFQLQH